MGIDSRIETLREEVEALKSRMKNLEAARTKDIEKIEVVTELAEMNAEDISKLKRQNRDYEQAFELASKEINEVKERVQLLGHEHSEQTAPPREDSGIQKEIDEEETLIESLTAKAVDACRQERPKIIAPEELGGTVSDPRNIFPRDWDVGMIVREYQRRAGNVRSN